MSELGDIEAWKEKLDDMPEWERKAYNKIREGAGVGATLHLYDTDEQFSDTVGRRDGEFFYFMDYWGGYSKYNLTKVAGKYLVMLPDDCYGIVKDMEEVKDD